jgi:hypothetical protein
MRWIAGVNPGFRMVFCFGFLDASPPEKKNIFVTFFAVNLKPTPLSYVIGAYLVKIILLFISQGSRPLLPFG